MESYTLLIRVKQYRNIVLVYSKQAVDGAAKKMRKLLLGSIRGETINTGANEKSILSVQNTN